MGQGNVFIAQGSVEICQFGGNQTKTKDVSDDDIKVLKLHAFASSTAASTTAQLLSKRSKGNLAANSKAASIQIRSMASSDQLQRLNEDKPGMKKPLGLSDPFTCVKLLFSGE